MTTGDQYNLPCPYCYASNHYVNTGQAAGRYRRRCVSCLNEFIIYSQSTIVLKANTLEEDPYVVAASQFNGLRFDYINVLDVIIKKYNGLRESDTIVRFPSSSLCAKALYDIDTKNLSVDVDRKWEYMFLVPYGFDF